MGGEEVGLVVGFEEGGPSEWSYSVLGVVKSLATECDGSLELEANRPTFGGMQLPADAGVIVLNTVLFPHGILPLHIFEPRYRKMLAEALESDRMFVVAMQRPGVIHESPCAVAGLGVVRYSIERPNGTSDLVLQGVARVRLTEVAQQKPYRRYRLSPLATKSQGSVAIDALVGRCVEHIEARVKQGFAVPQELLKQIAPSALHKTESEPGSPVRVDDPGLFADFVACLFLRSKPAMLQTLLEDLDVETRLRHLVHFLLNETHCPAEKNQPSAT